MIDLFAGIGGIRIGFKKAFQGLRTIYSCEIDKKVMVEGNLFFTKKG